MIPLDMKIKALLALIVAILAYFASDFDTKDKPQTKETKKNEKYYQSIFCKKHGGQTEVVLDDNTRVDCLTANYAIEVDWAKKWAESIGQALYYGIKTNKRPAVALIVEQKDHKHKKRLQTVAKVHKIKLYFINK
ncbi:MAG: hypothetical protein DRG11_00220 [Epsilonproteobacteria bacterium]|nr:MAG: hypothetical protein DRG11_00220 [Campylobacterota bacterium]